MRFSSGIDRLDSGSPERVVRVGDQAMNTPTAVRILSALRASIAIALCGLFASGCTSLQSIPSSDLSRLGTVVKAGDGVVCSLRDGTTAEFKVSSVEADAIIAEGGRRIAMADLTQVQVKKTDTTKSIWLGVGVVAVIAIAIAAGGGGGGGGGY